MYLSRERLLRNLRLGRDPRTVDESQWPADGGHPRWGVGAKEAVSRDRNT